MVLALIAASALTTQNPATDYFPLQPGMRWTYECSGSVVGSYNQEIGASTDIDGKQVTLVHIKERGKTTQTTFYEASENGVYILGHDAKKLFEKPQPVFILSQKGAEWTHNAPSPYDDDPSAGINLKGRSKFIGTKTYLGTKRECIEVKTEAKIGLTGTTATTFNTTTIYAKGIGMVEMQETAKIGKTSTQRKIVISKFELPQADGQ